MVDELTDALDPGDDDIAIIEESRGIEAEADPRGRAGGDDIARFEGKSGG